MANSFRVSDRINSFELDTSGLISLDFVVDGKIESYSLSPGRLLMILREKLNKIPCSKEYTTAKESSDPQPQ